MAIYRAGQLNTQGLTNPGSYIIEDLPGSQVVGVPTNRQGVVGVASWGQVGGVQSFSDVDSASGKFGVPQVRPHDLASYAFGTQLGRAVSYVGVRVSDGTDTAAKVSIPNGGMFTGRYTGVRGNLIQVYFQSSIATGAFAAVVSIPGRTPERFDNIMQAVSAFNVQAGSGYNSVPSVQVAPPVTANGRATQGGVAAQARASLVAVGVPTVQAPGSGYAVNDTIVLGAGVILKVTAIGPSGVVQTVSVVSAGQISSGPVPAGVGAQISSSGAGTGAAFAVLFGLGPVAFTPGYGYSSAPPVALTGGNPTTPGTITAAVSFWAALAYAINNGTTQRGASDYVVFTPGVGTANPVLGTAYALSGGTDGDTGVGTAELVGKDVRPRTGMYALRGSGCDAFALADLTDTSTWPTQIAFGISEGMLAATTTASGDSIANAVATRLAAGVDDPAMWAAVGDWPTIYDSVNGVQRLVSPQLMQLGLLGNLSPEQSPINKPLTPVLATQTSVQGILTDGGDESVAQTGGVDFIGRSSALNVSYFTFMTGRNTSSDTQANGVEFTRMENFIARSLDGIATTQLVGLLQSRQLVDPTRIRAESILNSFGAQLKDPASGSNGYGMIEDFETICNKSNNSDADILRGILQATFKAVFLSVVRYFIVDLQGGNSVNVTISTTASASGL